MPLTDSWHRGFGIAVGVGMALLALACVLCPAPATAEGKASADCRSYGGVPDDFPAVRAGMTFIPGGRFVMGSNGFYPEEGPPEAVLVAPFFMDVHEVTNAEFSAFVEATGHVTSAEKSLAPDEHPELPAEQRVPGAMVFTMPDAALDRMDPRRWWSFTPGANWRHPAGPSSSIEGRDNEPVTQVSYEDALAYARWRGHDLPSEAEWEWAARAGGNLSSDELRDAEEPPPANIWQGVFPFFDAGSDGYTGLAPVGCFAPNALGLKDMIGNVWEWTSDRYRLRHDAEPAQSGADLRVIKGGSWLCATSFCGRFRPTARQPGERDLGSSHIGFRTVWRPK